MARPRKPADVNALVGIDKPVGMTSHDVVARVRRAVGERRVGHAGTLDPMASGVMVVGIGQATRLLGMLTLDTKSYVAEIAFGAETNTDDAEGEVTRRAACPAELADEGFARRVLAGFLGEGEQVPPAFSAISVNGVRSYKRARAGEAVELPPRPVTVTDATLLNVTFAFGDVPHREPDESFGDVPFGDVPLSEHAAPAAPAAAPVTWTVSFTVSKGTYIRALARDIGRAAGSAAHVAALRRTASGSVTLADCLALDEVSPEAVRARALDPVRALGLPMVEVDEAALADIACGRAVPAAGVPAGASRVALAHGSSLAAIACPDSRGSLAMETVFPQMIEGIR